VSGLKGVRIQDSFTANNEGQEMVNYTTVTNVMPPVPGKQMYATIGAGWGNAALNRELAKSGLWALGASHGNLRSNHCLRRTSANLGSRRSYSSRGLGSVRRTRILFHGVWFRSRSSYGVSGHNTGWEPHDSQLSN
jgi:hypothetical protein